MSRYKKNPEQQLLALSLYRDGMSIDAITMALERRFDSPASRSLVGKWRKQFAEGEVLSNDIDKPFRWANMSDFNIPAEAGDFLLSVASRLSDYGDQHIHLQGLEDGFSFRDARWFWRVFNAVGGRIQIDGQNQNMNGKRESMDWISLLNYARTLSAAEMAREIAGVQVDVTHIEAELAYRPWESTAAANRYDAAMKAGLVHKPELINSMIQSTKQADELLKNGGQNA